MDANSELEKFRQQWKEEVSARRDPRQPDQPTLRAPSQISPTVQNPRVSRAQWSHKDYEETDAGTVDDSVSGTSKAIDHGAGGKQREPSSALEHYEKAVEREEEGHLGDSLTYYRKAFKLDENVDALYKHKHHGGDRRPLPRRTIHTEPVEVQHGAPKNVNGDDDRPLSPAGLIASFRNLTIERVPPPVAGLPEPPCPISHVPQEIIVTILQHLASMDLSSLGKAAQVCKRLAYLVATEEQVWVQACLGTDIGFGSMHYAWACDVYGYKSLQLISDMPEGFPYDAEPPDSPFMEHSPAWASEYLLKRIYASSYRQMLWERPRIRFNGCYISTVNYIRPGQATVSQVTWNSPVHIVTYYRYLRFYRDGSVLSLLTTSEPREVVPHLTKENFYLHQNGAVPHLASSVLANALRGRWRLCSINDRASTSSLDNQSDKEVQNMEGDVIVETEGVGPKDRYLYRMDLSLRSSNRLGAKNTKLVWRAYHNYNRLTDDWAEFTLRNDKAFIWSRVRSYDAAA